MYGSLFTISPFRSLEGFKHIATTFELSTTEEFKPEDIIHSHRVNLEDGDILKYNFSKYLVPMKIYWARALRHIDPGEGVGNVDHYTLSKKIMDDRRREEALIYGVENRIRTPWVNIDEDEYNSNSQYFTIRTSRFKSRSGGHVATHWWILDGTGSVLWKSLYNEEDKVSIKIPKLPEIINKNKLVFKAVHVGTVGVCSEPGCYYKEQTSFNFECVSKLNDVRPFEDYKLSLRRITLEDMNVHLVQVMNVDEVAYEIVNDREETELSFIIPGHLIKPKSTIEVVVTAQDLDGNIGRHSIYLKTGYREIKEVEDPDYMYKNQIKLISEDTERSYANRIVSMEIPLGYIPMVHNNSNKVYKYYFKNDKLTTNNEALDGVLLLSKENNETYIQYTQNNMLLIDCWSETNEGKKKPVLLVYKHNMATDTYSFINHIPHPEGDVNLISKNNSLVQLSHEEFLYIPNSLGSIYKFNVFMGTVEKVIDIPIQDMIGSKNDIVIRLLKGRMLVYGGVNCYSYLYDHDKGEFSRSIVIEPVSFGKGLTKARRLVNGDTIIFKYSRSEDDKDKDVLIFNSRTNKLEQLDYTFGEGRNPDGMILLLDNSLLLTRRALGTAETDLVDTYLIYKYY